MIRSLTMGVPIYSRSKQALARQLEAFGGHLARLGQELGIQTRTVRLTLPVAPSGGEGHQPGALSSVMDGVRDLADVLGARWYCLPLDLLRPGAHGAVLDEAQTLVLRDSRLFVNLIAADPDVISIEGAHSASRFILSLARRGNTGIDNFRVGVSAACPAGTPFFPFSRHEGDEPGFSLALETASLALQCAERARAEQGSLLEFQERLIEALAAEMRRVDAFGRALEEASGVEYRGLDGSLAPFPDGVTSIGRLVELLGPSPVGAHGTIFITSVLSDAIKTACVRAQARTVGFNGVMYSLLEDNGLAGANNLRAVTIEKLAVFSTVCGCGIDMVPVPGTMFAEDLAGLVLDISALAVRLRKPLGVRVLPIPTRTVNEMTQLNLDFLCDSRVMDVGISASAPMLSGGAWRYAANRAESEKK
jgi:uncharacterized protein (UPF0210 family)